MTVVSTSQPERATRPRNSAGNARDQHHTRGLLLVAIFKLLKACFFFLVGVGALHLLNRDIGDLAMRLMAYLPIDPEGRLFSVVMNKADLIGNHQLRQAGLFSILYACVCIVEGVGLYLEKTWAEYFTVILTILALPWEIYEIFRDASGFRIALLVLNVLVLVYLLWLIRRKQANHCRSSS